MTNSPYCGNCGGPAAGTRFCERCGAESRTIGVRGGPMPVAETPTMVTGPPAWQAQAPPNFGAAHGMQGATPPPTYVAPGAQRSKRPWIVAGIVGGAGLLGAVGVLIGLVVIQPGGNQVNGGQSTQGQQLSFSQKVPTIVHPIIEDNGKITFALAGLTATSDVGPIKALFASAQSDTQTAQSEVSSAHPAGVDATLSGQVSAALTAEAAWLQVASNVVADPSNADSSQLPILTSEAETKLQALGSAVGGAAQAPFPPANPITEYAAAVKANAAAVAANTQFVNQVSALLDQSASSFKSVNDFFQQLNAVVNGGSASFTLSQAEQQISSIIANRNSLEAAAQALNAPTPQAQSVASLLVDAFRSSLTDDNDLDTCLNQQNFGTVAVIYKSCLDSTVSDSQAATSAKDAFRSAYNVLRQSIGMAPVSPQF